MAKSAHGLSFVEVLIGITVLAIVAGSVFTAITFASRVSQHNVNKTIALNLARERMDQIRNTTYNSIISPNFPPESGIVVGSHPVSFNRSVSIQTASYKTIVVTVTWSHLGAPFVESEQLATIISSS